MSHRQENVAKSRRKRKREREEEEAAVERDSKKMRTDDSIELEDGQKNVVSSMSVAVGSDASLQKAQEQDPRAQRKLEKKQRKQREREEAAERAASASKDYNLKQRPQPPVNVEPVEDEETLRKRRRKEEKKARRAVERALTTTSMDLVRRKSEDQGAVAKPSKLVPQWTLGDPTGGRFLDHDPVFVQDENGDDFLISASNREIQVLSLETSLVVRTHPAPADKAITCVSVDGVNENYIRVGYSDGNISAWDWVNDFEFDITFAAEGKVIALAPVTPADENDPSLIHLSMLGQQYGVFYDKLLLFSTKQGLESIEVLGRGDYVVCRGSSTLVIGQKKGRDTSFTEYIWIEIPLTANSTSSDARLIHSPPTGKKGTHQPPALALALGTATGQVNLYSDLSSLFNSHSTHRTLPIPRILHWHREAVSSVKFSHDGNYLISGGKETVLVIWQLETGKKQFLPHLTSQIERIVVSPRGDRYAVQMGDNSIIVLSTSELKPVALFAGLQMVSRTGQDLSGVAATLHPKHPHQLLLSVPSSQPKSAKDISSRPFLQTFNTLHARHTSRQALTRNNVTDFNLGPERTPIIPPDVQYLAISYDGKWLATVDEWMPPRSDLEYLTSDEVELAAEREKRREVFLKIWIWDEGLALWTLSTRVDAPHARARGEGMGAGRVLGLVSNPAKEGFATAGEDDCVRVWTPKRKKMHGVVVKDMKDTEVVEWRCRYLIRLPRDSDDLMDSTMATYPRKACLAYSDDGSLLAVSQTNSATALEEPPVVHFIDTYSGAIAAVKAGMANADIEALGFLERYFIVVSHPAAYVWDLVNDTLVYKINLSPSYDGISPALAVNSNDATFAIVIDGVRVEVYSAKQSVRLHQAEFETQVEPVLSAKGTRGYTLLFADATIRTLTPVGGSSQPRSLQKAEEPLALTASPTTQAVELEPAADAATVDPTTAVTTSKQEQRPVMFGEDEDDRSVVRPEQMAKIFDVGQSFAMPPVREMFREVVGLFGRKPLTRCPAEVAV